TAAYAAFRCGECALPCDIGQMRRKFAVAVVAPFGLGVLQRGACALQFDRAVFLHVGIVLCRVVSPSCALQFAIGGGRHGLATGADQRRARKECGGALHDPPPRCVRSSSACSARTLCSSSASACCERVDCARACASCASTSASRERRMAAV